MLTLNDGRSELWQWDTGRTLAVDADCSQVHFSNKVFGRSIDVDVVDGVAIIPDILLQTDKDLNTWAFVGTAENGYTKISKTFKVNRRNKPADYVFTPVEQTTIAEIAAIAQSVRDDADAGLFNGEPGDNGITPHIGDNGNWYLGVEDTGKPSRGVTGAKGDTGAAGPAGPQGPAGEPGKDGAGMDITGATIGQIAKISAVDASGVPTAWSPADMPSGGGVQSDWNQNDDTQPDYVKNRPFYSETKNVTIENVTDAKLEGFPTFVTGDTVTVNVDGVEHSLVAYYDESEGVFTVGDIYSSIENGEGQLGWQIYADASGAFFYAKEAHTISYLGVFIYKIDDKFLNLDGLVRTFDYHFKDYALYKTLYNSDGDECTLYTSSDFILPKPGSKLFGCMSGLGFSIVDSVYLYSCFITCVKIDTINSRISIVRVVLGANTSEMETMAADNGYTYTTNPKA